MLALLRAFRLATTQLTGAGLRRLAGRRAHPSWSLMYEATAGVVRSHLTAFDVGRVVRFRSYHDALPALVTGTPKTAIEDVGQGGVSPAGRWLRPREGDSRGVLLFFHGGGYCIGTARTSTDVLARLVNTAGCEVFSLDYRLAPEHPYPAALEDALAAYRWLLSEGVAPEQIVVSGDSAGGGLALALMLTLRDEGDPLPAGAALLSPWVDLEDRGAGSDDWQGLDTLTPRTIGRFADAYLGATDPRNPRISMVHADLTGLPPLLIQAGEVELFREQIQRFAERAREAGVVVQHEVAPGMVHVWHYLANVSPEGREAIDVVARFARDRWETGHQEGS